MRQEPSLRIAKTRIRTVSRWLGVVLVTAMLPGLAGCQPKGPQALSLAEAKKVTATFEGQSFVPPPKTIEEITAILDQQKPDPRAISAMRAKLAAPLPSAEGDSLARFYHERGRAVEQLGNLEIARADYREEVKNVHTKDLQSWILFETGLTDTQLGRIADAIRHLKVAIDLIPEDFQGRAVVWNGVLTNVLIHSGDLKGAEESLRRTESTMEILAGTPSWDVRGPTWAMIGQRANARVLAARGEYAEAERLYRSVLRALKGRRESLSPHIDEGS